MDRKEASKKNIESHVRAAKDCEIKNARRIILGKYGQGELVLIALKGPGIVRGSGLAKSMDTWASPFEVVWRYQSGSYQLRELDGTIIKGSVPTSHLKPFYTGGGQRPDKSYYLQMKNPQKIFIPSIEQTMKTCRMKISNWKNRKGSNIRTSEMIDRKGSQMIGYDKKITNISRNQHTTAVTIISKYGEQYSKRLGHP